MRERSKGEPPGGGGGLEYGSAGFGARVRELIDAGERVTFAVSGTALDLLRPYVAKADMSELMGATVVPELRDLVVAVVLAQSRGMRVSISVLEAEAHVELGSRLN